MYKFFLLFFCFSYLFQCETTGQIIVYGPACVIPNAGYQYNIDGLSGTDTTMSICVTGGHILDRDTNCYIGASLAFIRVIWDENANSASIGLTTTNGSASITVSITSVLKGGKIDSADLLSVVDNDSVSFSIHCSPASGGNCQPAYSYQWQQSLDGTQWTDIVGVVNPDLAFSGVTAATNFRRKVKESSSNTVEYSDIAIVSVP